MKKSANYDSGFTKIMNEIFEHLQIDGVAAPSFFPNTTFKIIATKKDYISKDKKSMAIINANLPLYTVRTAGNTGWACDLDKIYDAYDVKKEDGYFDTYFKGKLMNREYKINGKYHRENGPARIVFDENGKVIFEQWFLEGKRILI